MYPIHYLTGNTGKGMDIRTEQQTLWKMDYLITYEDAYTIQDSFGYTDFQKMQTL